MMELLGICDSCNDGFHGCCITKDGEPLCQCQSSYHNWGKQK